MNRPISQSAIRQALVVGALLLAGVAAPANAGTISLTTGDAPLLGNGLNQGWWHVTDGHLPYYSNVGTSSQYGYRSFFIFNLDLLDGATATSATLRIFNHQNNANLGAGPWGIDFFDITSNLVQVKTAWNSSTIYNDLGSGINYGHATFSTLGDYATFTLNATALAAINNHGGGMFGIGASLTTPGLAFSFTSNTLTYLDVQTLDPVPPSAPLHSSQSVPDATATLGLIGAALGFMAAFARRASR